LLHLEDRVCSALALSRESIEHVTNRTALKKLGRVDTPTFSTESTQRGSREILNLRCNKRLHVSITSSAMAFTEQYPAKMPARITVRLQDGKVIEHEFQDFPGLASHPFTWEDSVEKFDRLVAGRVDG
jgi:MmgE/PrpD C-terminal domain